MMDVVHKGTVFIFKVIAMMNVHQEETDYRLLVTFQKYSLSAAHEDVTYDDTNNKSKTKCTICINPKKYMANNKLEKCNERIEQRGKSVAEPRRAVDT